MTHAARTAGATAIATASRMITLTMGASLFSFLFILSYGYAIHSPRPHHVRIDVVAAAATVRAVGAELNGAEPGGFDVRAAADVQSVRRAVLDNSTYAGLIEPPSGPATIFTASAAGLSVQQVVTTALTAETQAEGRTVRTVDLVPLPTGDRAGQSSFIYEIGLLIPGVIGSVGFFLLGRRARLWVRVAAATVYAVLASALGVLVLDVCLGALTGSPWTLLATGMLVAAAFVLTVAALHALVGLPGTAVAAAILLVVGNALNGSTVPIPLLPDGFRQIAPWLPNGAAVHAFRSDVYFSGHGQGQPMIALAVWAGAALLAIALADNLHLRRRRVAPASHEQIHASSVLHHVRTRRAARGASGGHDRVRSDRASGRGTPRQ